MVLCEVTHEELALDLFYPSLNLGKLIHLNMGIFVWRDSLDKRWKILQCKVSWPTHSLNSYWYAKELFKRKNTKEKEADPCITGLQADV